MEDDIFKKLMSKIPKTQRVIEEKLWVSEAELKEVKKLSQNISKLIYTFRVPPTLVGSGSKQSVPLKTYQYNSSIYH